MTKNKYIMTFHCTNCGKVWDEEIPTGCFVEDNVIYSQMDMCSIKTIICPKCKCEKINKNI